MKTDELAITQLSEALGDILDKVEWIALYAGMTRRDAVSARLLAEELLTAAKDIMETYQGRMWMETSDQTFSIHLRADKPTRKAERDQLVALSATGKATPLKGLFSRLGAALSKVLLTDDDDATDVIFAEYALFPESAGMGGPICCYHYLPERAEPSAPRADAREDEPGDELAGIEKRIIDVLVDDIHVSVSAGYVDIVAVKNL